MATNWRQIAKQLSQALASVPNVNVWRDYADGYTPAINIVDFWSEEADAAGERWQAAEHDAACDDLFNSSNERPSS